MVGRRRGCECVRVGDGICIGVQATGVSGNEREMLVELENVTCSDGGLKK